MKLLIFSPYYPPHIGGLESYADEFNKYLSSRGMDITVFTPRLPLDSPEIEIKFKQEFKGVHPVKSGEASPAKQEFNRVKIIRFPAFEIIPNYPLPKFWSIKFWQLFFGLFKKNFDFTISHTRFFITSILALIYSKIKKLKWVHIEHGSDFVQSGNSVVKILAKLYDLTFGKLVFQKADKIVAVSSHVKNFVKRLAPKKECYVIYRGFDLEKIDKFPPNLAMAKNYKDKIIITYVGRLISGKGVADLIEVISQLENKKKIVCFLIGDGSQRKELENKVKKMGLENTVVFYGYKNYAETIGLLKISDIFVNPSYTEGLPTTVIEAAFCQKAIIATNVGGTGEIITDQKSGQLINPRDITALKYDLEILINDKKLRERLGNNAYQKAKSKFNWNRALEKYQAIFSAFKR